MEQMERRVKALHAVTEAATVEDHIRDLRRFRETF